MLGVALFLLAAAAGQDEKLDCRDVSTQSEMSQCAYLDFQKADAELNRQWTRARAAMAKRDKDMVSAEPGPTYAQALLASQRAWLAYRDAQCEIEGYAMRGGTAQPMLVSGCKATLTRERVKELADIVETY